jgi:hypothetical protein
LSVSEPKKMPIRSRRKQRFFAGPLGRTLQDCGSSTAGPLKSQDFSASDVPGGLCDILLTIGVDKPEGAGL